MASALKGPDFISAVAVKVRFRDSGPPLKWLLRVTERHLWQCRSASPLEFDLLRDGYSIIHFDAEVAHGALQLGMTEEQLNRTNVAGLFVDQ